jgi:L-rhamnose-H+ transport protein
VLGALLAVPAGHGLFELYAAAPKASLLTMFFGVLWGVGGLTFGLSMRYLGVALGQSIALGTCAGLGTIMGPVLLNAFFPELDALSALTSSVIIGVVVTLAGIAIIGIAGGKSKAAAILSVIRASRQDILVTDEAAAREIVRMV